MQVKSDSESETSVIEMTIANSRLALGGTAGTITWDVDDSDMDITPNSYIYDLEVYNSTTDNRETVLRGKFIVNADVSR
jgi:hypothetical protein